MNIVLFTQEDPFYVKKFFDVFFSKYKPLDDIKTVVISRPMGKKTLSKLAQQMYEFYGPFDFLRMGTKYVYYKAMGKWPVQPATSGRPQKTFTIRQLANSYGLPVVERSDLNSQDFINMVKQHNADLFISVASPIIFKENLIKTPKLDCINIHNAPLPNYRGMLPNFWQLYHGEKNAGITIHRIFTGIDTGDIIKQITVPITPDDSLHDLIVKTKMKGAELMIEVISDYKNGTVKYEKMTGEGSYFSFPKRQDVKEFRKRGKRLL